MIPEIGHFALIIGLCLALVLAVIPAWGAWRYNATAMALAPSLAVGMLVFVGIALSFSLNLTYAGSSQDWQQIAPAEAGFLPEIGKMLNRAARTKKIQVIVRIQEFYNFRL